MTTKKRALAEAETASIRAHRSKGVIIGRGADKLERPFDTAGYVTEAGSDLLKGRVPQKDAFALEKQQH